MDGLPRHQLEESRDSSAITSLPYFEQGLGSICRVQYTEIDALLTLAKELDTSGLRKPGNALRALMQEWAQYQLIQKELSETIARSTSLSSVMQEKIDFIISLLRVLLTDSYSTNLALTKEQAQHIADASAVPALAELLVEKTTDFIDCYAKRRLAANILCYLSAPFRFRNWQ